MAVSTTITSRVAGTLNLTCKKKRPLKRDERAAFEKAMIYIHDALGYGNVMLRESIECDEGCVLLVKATTQSGHSWTWALLVGETIIADDIDSLAFWKVKKEVAGVKA